MFNKKSKKYEETCKTYYLSKQYNIKFVRADTVKKLFQLNRGHLVPKDLNLITNT